MRNGIMYNSPSIPLHFNNLTLSQYAQKLPLETAF